MENSGFVSSPPLPPTAHLTSAAAAFQAASTAAGMNFQEALLSRMGRGPFGLTVRHKLCLTQVVVLSSNVTQSVGFKT